MASQTAEREHDREVYQACYYEDLPTIHDCDFVASADAEALMTAMKGCGTDEDTLINVLCYRTQNQRQKIANAFKANYEKDLIKTIKSETSGNFKKVLVGLLTPRIDYLAKALHRAVDGPGTTESFLIDIICTASNHELKVIQYAYRCLYQTCLKADIMGDTSGHFRHILVSLLDGHRHEHHLGPHDASIIQADALALHSADISCWGVDDVESVFTKIMTTRSCQHLRQVFIAYEKMCGHSIETSIKNEFTGDAKKAMMAIVTCIQNRATYYAQRLRKAMKGAGTNDRTLVFIIVSRCDIDLQTIKLEYRRLFNKSLVKDVASDTSGDYKKALLALLGEDVGIGSEATATADCDDAHCDSHDSHDGSC